jgi:hypothetical protein
MTDEEYVVELNKILGAKEKTVREVIVSTLNRWVLVMGEQAMMDKESLASHIVADLALAGYHIYEHSPRKP